MSNFNDFANKATKFSNSTQPVKQTDSKPSQMPATTTTDKPTQPDKVATPAK